MAAGDILQAPVLDTGIIQGDPARQVSHRLCPGPVGVVLVPGDDPPMLGGLYKELIMKEPHGPAQQLVGGHL